MDQMTQEERRLCLIRRLLAEQPRFAGTEIPSDEGGQRRLLRSLFNVRPPGRIDDDFLAVQDAYLSEVNRERGIVELSSLRPREEGIYLYQGDITTLAVDAIVNAANSGMTGCYVPCHNCIDNCIHTYAGVELRNACAELMAAQGHEERTGGAKLTEGYNLPCRYVLHTVGPIVSGPLTAREEDLLASCYRSCLHLAAEHGIRSVAFCCISTGVFSFPNQRAAEIAVQTVRAFRDKHPGEIEVVFNVWKDIDREIYEKLLA